MAKSELAQPAIPTDTPQRNKLGQYLLLEKIAQGGMAEVYKARTVDASGIERLVVIKRILPHISSNPEYVDMLIDEAKIAVHFTHGNIAQIYDLGRVGSDYFIVMEYVVGKTFSQIYKVLLDRHQKIPLDVLLYCFIELCHGLSYIHRKTDPTGKLLGVVHRDISPQNIILSYTGNVKVIDFGVAKATFLEDKTETGVLKGKFAYMSPEQTRGEKLDHRSDIFSMGTLLWEMSTGERLFKRKINKETIKAVQRVRFDVPSSRRADIPRALDRVIKKALSKSPRHRYNDASEMASELEKLLYSINPDFRPIAAAKFLYDLFGPEKDEKDLPPPFFVKPQAESEAERTDRQSVLSQDQVDLSHAGADEPGDETTIKEFFDHLTPLVRMPQLKQKFLQYRLQVLSILVLILFAVGSAYVYSIHRHSKMALLWLDGRRPEMTVTISGQPVASLDGPIELDARRDHDLQVTQAGFYPLILKLKLHSKETRHVALALKPVPPPTGDIRVSSLPPGASIYLDEKDTGLKTPSSIIGLMARQGHQIGLFLTGYDFVTREVEIVGGKELHMDVPLSPTPAVIFLTSEPAGAEVFIDGKSVGITPLTLDSVKPALEHVLRMTLPGFSPHEERLSFTAGEHKALHIPFQAPADSVP